MIVGVDFDGTIVTHEYPRVGKPVPGAIEKMKEMVAEGHKLILWTMRSGASLVDATHYLKENGVQLFGVNSNPEQFEWTSSPKAYCHVYIDDAAFGCPLIHEPGHRPYVDWSKINLGPAK